MFRATLVPLRIAAIALTALASSACGTADTAGRAAPVTPVSASQAEPTSEPSPEASPSGSSSAEGPEPGPAMGTVDAVIVFDDPANQIADADDLVAYVLPGLRGDGVNCVRDRLDPDEILSMDVSDGSAAVTSAVLDCVEPGSYGDIVAMYAVGLGPDGPEWFDRVSSCANGVLYDAPTDEVRAGLESIFDARLDLNAPPTSPDIAFAFLEERSDCLMWLVGTSTPDESSEPATPSEPETPSATETPQGPVPDETIRWDLLRAGQCVSDLPDGDFAELTTTDCANPHEAEVTGTDLPLAGTELSTCEATFASYTGRAATEMADVAVDYISSTDTFANPVLICLAVPVDGQPMTGSMAA